MQYVGLKMKISMIQGKERCRIHGKSSLIGSKASSILPNNPPILQSKYPILDYHNIDTSTLKDNPLGIIYLKNFVIRS